jgi:multiple sugar transport system substrate-binding protein
MMKRRTFLSRSLATAGTLTSAGVLLDACGSSTPGSSGPVNLNIMIDGIDTTIGAAQVSAFEKAHNCKILVAKFDQVRLNASIAAGSPPDLVRTEGASEMPNLIARGLVESLDSYLQKSTLLKIDDLDPVVGVYKFDGKSQGKGPIYGLPANYSQDSMTWYNKKLFDKANIPYLSETEPATLDQLVEIGKKLTVTTGGKIQTYGFDPVWNFVNQGRIMEMMAQQGGATLWNADFTKADFTQPEARKALQWFVDWAQARVGISPLDTTSDWDGPIYSAERMGVVSYGYWFNGWINQTPGLIDHSGFAPTAQIGTTRVEACRTGSGSWIPKKAKNKDLAFQFLEFWLGGPPAVTLAKGGNGFPILKSQRSLLPQTTSAEVSIFKVAEGSLPYFKILQFSPYADKAAMEAAITTAIEPVMKGQVSLDAGIATLQQKVDTIVTQGRSQIGN